MNQPIEHTAEYGRQLIDEYLGKDFIAKLHADFKMVSTNRQKEGEWTKQDAQDIGLSVKAAIDAGNYAAVVFWAQEIGVIASQYVGFRSMLLAAEARMLAQARRDRDDRAAADVAKSRRRVAA